MNLPKEFLNRMQEMLESEFPLFLKSYENGKVYSLRNNTLKCRDISWNQNSNFMLTPVEWCKEGYYYEEENRPGRHPYHDAGLYYIQDASAMAPVEYLDPQPGERILDLCAAPGGKSTQIAAKMKQRGLLVSNEIHPARAKILSENIERMGIRNVLVVNETPDRLAEVFPNYFEKILVDAPCSGEGMFRKNEEACQEWSLENVQHCADRQDEILNCAAEMLMPGGRLVYSTCTFELLENEGSVSRFLEHHKEFSVEEVELFSKMGHGYYESTIRLWPHHIKGEGHFLAVLRKHGESFKRHSINVMQKGCKQAEYQEYLDFAKEYLKILPEGIFLKFGEQLYLLPKDCPSINRLRALRPGLHLGTCKKNRFEPGHALAMALKPEEVRFSCNFSADSNEIAAYLNGQTLNMEDEKGWYMVTVDGYSLGWGKLSGTTLKNHYPKGLRVSYSK